MKSELLRKTGEGALKFARKNVVMLIALLLAIVTCFLVPPDEQYLNYFDLRTLSCAGYRMRVKKRELLLLPCTADGQAV